jgi:outer membrane protein OmpA-like peptidoglycan-associated protein
MMNGQRIRLRMVFCCAILSLGLRPWSAGCEEFIYRHQTGDKYRILSTVREDVYVNRQLTHKAEILNRIAVEVTGETGGKGRHKAVFQTSERAVRDGAAVRGRQQPSGDDRTFQWTREYESVFDRDRLGYLTIDKQYFMPVVRDVPVFPGKDLKIGDKWSAEGHEMHDFRDSLGITEPYRIPFTANYVFLGKQQWKGKTYPAFSVNYRIAAEPEAVPGHVWPKRISGSSNQTVYWDSGMGQPVAYRERFSMVLELSNKQTWEFRGEAEAEVIESQRMEKKQIAEEIAEEIKNMQIPDVTVRVVDEGITLSLDDIRFQAETANMLPGEREKLDKIAEILLRYRDRDILVGGHTALAGGNAKSRMDLSLKRAGVVADYLLGKNVRTADRVVVRGYGAEQPVADNRTEEGRRKNRRVEITILEN